MKSSRLVKRSNLLCSRRCDYLIFEYRFSIVRDRSCEKATQVKTGSQWIFTIIRTTMELGLFGFSMGTLLRAYFLCLFLGDYG